jgi:hypothetical protein
MTNVKQNTMAKELSLASKRLLRYCSARVCATGKRFAFSREFCVQFQLAPLTCTQAREMQFAHTPRTALLAGG